MLTAADTGLLCGNRGDEALVEWLHVRRARRQTRHLPVVVWYWMGDTRTPPQKDCFRDLLMALDPDEFQAVLSEDRSTIAGGHAPQKLAALRNAGLNWLRNQKTDNIAATLRSFTRNPLRLFRKLGYQN